MKVLSETAVVYLAMHICVLFGLKWKWMLICWLFKHKTIIPLYAQFDYGSWLLWWLLCEYCDSFFLSFFDNNAQYRRKIVAKSWIRHKARSNSHGKLPPTVSLGLPSIIMRPTCSQHAANILPCIVFCFLPPPTYLKHWHLTSDIFSCGKDKLTKSKKNNQFGFRVEFSSGIICPVLSVGGIRFIFLLIRCS